MVKRTAPSEDEIDAKEGRGSGRSNATPKKVDTTSNETDDPTVKAADKEARAWHGFSKPMKGR
jgi:hypothetical protein